MFTRYYHHTLFPYVIISLSLLLLGFMVWSFQGRVPEQGPIMQEEVVKIDPREYERAVVDVVQAFEDVRTQSAIQNSDLVQASEQALQQLLALHVPAQYKDLHLSLAVALSKMKESYRPGGEADAQWFEALLGELENTYAWFTIESDLKL